MKAKMKAKNVLASFVGVFVFVVLALLVVPTASAFASIDAVYIDGVFYDGNGGEIAGVFAGETLPIKVVFTASEGQEDVRINARILGEAGLSEQTERFDVIADSTYRRLLHIDLPNDIDPNEKFILEVSVESNSKEADFKQIELEIQRESYNLEILSVAGDDEVTAGDTLALDVVLKNLGRHELEDNFVIAEIPELGISTKVFFGDLSAVDEDPEFKPEKFDSAERRMYLKIPSNAETGVYDVELTAFNDDSDVTVIKRIVVVSGLGTDLFTSGNTERFAVGENADYSMTIVNAGNTIQVYELIVDSDEKLNVDLSETMIVIPAGSSKNVKITADAVKEGDFSFTVNVHSEGQLIQSETFSAKVEGEASAITSGNAAVVLTIILAIIFIVLLVVLIVLLTRKPETKEDFGESYY